MELHSQKVGSDYILIGTSTVTSELTSKFTLHLPLFVKPTADINMIKIIMFHLTKREKMTNIQNLKRVKFVVIVPKFLGK